MKRRHLNEGALQRPARASDVIKERVPSFLLAAPMLARGSAPSLAVQRRRRHSNVAQSRTPPRTSTHRFDTSSSETFEWRESLGSFLSGTVLALKCFKLTKGRSCSASTRRAAGSNERRTVAWEKCTARVILAARQLISSSTASCSTEVVFYT